MVSLQSYLNDPCATTSIPYWKYKSIEVPPNMKIVHQREMTDDLLLDYNDEPYFRLYHDLKNIRQATAQDVEIVSGGASVSDFVQLINRSYTDLSVSAEQIENYRHTPVYRPDLWILLKERDTQTVLAGGIADYDEEIGELILEWIQVLPQYRMRGYGQIVVNTLLSKMQNTAKFATVSGKVNNATKPEYLYRKCGFVGTDIWHILTRKQSHDFIRK